MNFFHRFSVLVSLSVFLFCLFTGIMAIYAEDLLHEVGKGETIYSISRFYRVTESELMKVNNITDPSKLRAGQRLVIPSSAFSNVSVKTETAISNNAAPAAAADYKVVRGDTLYSIARNYGVSLQALLDMNKFSANHIIKIGDVIKVPSKNGTNTNTVTSNPASGNTAASIYSLRWPVVPKEIAYMTGQMGIVAEGEFNESVKSLTQGSVISAGPWRKFGRVVIVETSGGYFYMYGGCESLSVNVGDKITPGTEVGKLGINAVSDKPQLFFMVFRNDTPIDPALAPRAAGITRI